MCGLPATAVPRLLLRHLPAHRLGHERAGRVLVLCPDCESEVP